MDTQKNRGGGLSPPGKTKTETSLSGVDPLNWQSFNEIGEMACSTTAWYSRGQALKPSYVHTSPLNYSTSYNFKIYNIAQTLYL